MGTLKLTWLILNIAFVFGQLTSDQKEKLQSICPYRDTCPQTNVTGSCCLPCSCDISNCVEKGSCCPHLNTTNLHSGSDIDTNISPKASCVTATLNLKDELKKLSDHEFSVSFARLGVYMVTTCPDGTNETRCTNPDTTVLNESVPTMSKVNNVFYRNIFCALCNDENDDDIVPWKTYITCSITDILKADDLLFPVSADAIFKKAVNTDKGVCGVEFLPPNVSIDRNDLCFEDDYIISKCPENYTDQTIITACRSLHMPYTAFVENRTQIYENYFCYQCNTGDTEGRNLCLNGVQLQLHTGTTLVAELNIEKTNSSYLMSPWLQDDLTPSRYIPSGVICRDGTVYDPYKERCREWYCPSGRQLADDGDCVPNYVDVEQASYTMALNFVPDEDSYKTYASVNMTELGYMLLDEFFSHVPGLHTEIIVLALKESYTYMYVYVKLTFDSDTKNKSMVFDSATYGRNVSVHIGNFHLSFSVDLSIGTKIELSILSINDAAVIDRLDYTALVTIVRPHKDKIKETFKFATINKLTFCTQILLTADEIFDYVEALDVIVSDMRLNVGEFARTAKYSDVHICLEDYLCKIDEYLEMKNKRLHYTPQAIVSVVCNMLSMAGLLITIFTYILFDELRSIPGKNNMMLALHLLVAQCLYQFGMDKSEYPDLCIAMGALIHWFWLTAISWMNACTLHMFRTFVTGQSYRSVRAIDPQVCCYALYCYGVATSMVAINMGVSVYRKIGDNTDTTNGVEMNTAKISLTAGSTSTKALNFSRKGTNGKNVVSKVNTVAKAKDTYSMGHSNGHDLVNDNSIGSNPVKSPTIKTNPGGHSDNIGNVEKSVINDVPALAIVAMGIRDTEFIPASTK
ncbi:hypothetical protein ACF0H5_017266 [Mactra antiquata]